MEYNEVLTLFFTILCIGALFVGYTVGYSRGSMTGWKTGFADAKELYYDHPKEDRDEMVKQKLERIAEENNQSPKITPEILMAYGVEDTMHLPEEVKHYYGINGVTPTMDLEHLLKHITEEEDDDRY